MKTLLSVLALSFMSASFACDSELKFVEKSIKNPATVLGRELKKFDVVSIEKIPGSSVCEFRIISQLETEDGDIASCFTPVLVKPGIKVPYTRIQTFKVEFLIEERTNCFI